MLDSEIRQYRLSKSLVENVAMVREILENDGVLRVRDMETCRGLRMALFYFDGMVDNLHLDQHVVRPLMQIDRRTTPETIISSVLTVGQAEILSDLVVICEGLQMGDAAVFIDGYPVAIVASVKGYVTRSVEEPDNEKNIHGPHEGFNESIITNISLIRRKLLTSDVKFDLRNVSKRSGQKICLCYLDSIVDKRVLGELEKRLEKINVDTMIATNYLEEHIKDSKWTLLKTVGNTEKPDIAAAKMIEGKIVILMDGCPLALSVPYLFLEYFQNPNDYYNSFWHGTTVRILRYIGLLIAVSTPAIYLSLVSFHQEMLPTKLLVSIAAAMEGVPMPAALELVIMLLAFELLREASATLPNGIGNAISTVGGIIIGQAAVSAHFISYPLIIIIAITGLTDLLSPELKTPALYARLFLVFLTYFIGVYGYTFGIIIILIHMISLESFGIQYTAFLGTHRLRDLRDTVVRMPFEVLGNRDQNTIGRLGTDERGDDF